MRLNSTAIFIVISIVTVIFGAIAEPIGKRCSDESKMTFENWREWAQVTPKPMRSAGHNGNWVGIYVDDQAKDTYLNARAPYPVCATIIKPIYFDAEGSSVRKLTIMVKMRPGYDPDNGDWWYAHADPSGSIIQDHGRLDGCIPCHKQAAKTDYLFSNEVLNAMKQ